MTRIDSIRNTPVFWVSILVCAPLFTLSAQKPAQSVGPVAGPEGVESIQELSPMVGWVSSKHRLFWTSDAGAHWSSITPATKPRQNISAVFFLDVNRGWVLLSYPRGEETEFEIASTIDAGGHWSIEHLDVPDPSPDVGLSGDAWIDFADPMHGWVIVRMSTSTATSWGVLIATQDGGKTWKPRGQPPAAGALRFVTPQMGWLADDSGALYGTDDAGVHWREASVKGPSDTNATYDLPTFRDSRHGLLPVLFEGPNSTTRTLFASSDGGRSWNVRGQVAQGRAATAPDAMIDSTWIGAAAMPDHGLTVETVAVNNMLNASIAGNIGNTSISNVQGISFSTERTGWVAVGLANCMSIGGRACVELLSTTDGGGNWVNITPQELKTRTVPTER